MRTTNPILFFHGELMECIICGKKQKSNPEIESNWRCFDLGYDRYYACPSEFPSDETGSKQDFTEAYLKILIKIHRKGGLY